MEEKENANAQFAQYKKADKFLELLTENGNVTLSCKLSGFKRREAYRIREADEEFKKAWDASLLIGIEAMEDEAIRRAFQGISTPVYYQGIKVDTVKEYSDTLLIFLLKGKKPEVYKDRSEVTGKISTQNQIDLSNLSIDELRILEKLVSGSGKG